MPRVKLTEPQIAALRAAVKGELFYHRRNHPQATIDALRRRGLVGNYVHGSYEITAAGRAALLAVTEDAWAEWWKKTVPVWKPGIGRVKTPGHGGGCRCDECKLTEGP